MAGPAGSGAAATGTATRRRGHPAGDGDDPLRPRVGGDSGRPALRGDPATTARRSRAARRETGRRQSRRAPNEARTATRPPDKDRAEGETGRPEGDDTRARTSPRTSRRGPRTRTRTSDGRPVRRDATRARARPGADESLAGRPDSPQEPTRTSRSRQLRGHGDLRGVVGREHQVADDLAGRAQVVGRQLRGPDQLLGPGDLDAGQLGAHRHLGLRLRAADADQGGAPTASTAAGSVAAAEPSSVTVGQAARWIEPVLPPRPDLLGHVGQERREQPQLHVERERQRGPGGRRSAAPPSSPYARSLTSSR